MDKSFDTMKERVLSLNDIFHGISTTDSEIKYIKTISTELLEIMLQYYEDIDLKIGDIVRIDYDVDIFNKLFTFKAHPSYLYMYGECVVTNIKNYCDTQEYVDYISTLTRSQQEEYRKYKESGANPVTIDIRQFKKTLLYAGYNKIYHQRDKKIYVSLINVKRQMLDQVPIHRFDTCFNIYDLLFLLCLRKNSNKSTDFDSIKELVLPRERKARLEAKDALPSE